MTITTITRFHYPEDSEEYRWRLNYFKNEVLPRIKEQDTDINVWCNDWQRSEIESLGVDTFSVDTETRTNKLGYFVDFASWKQVKGLEKYDVQIGLDSDDIIEPNFIDKVKEICSDQDSSTFISFQPELLNTKTGEKYQSKRTYHKKGSPIFAIYQPDKTNYKFAYHDSHLKLPKYCDNFYFVDKGYCYQSVHNYNDSTTI